MKREIEKTSHKGAKSTEYTEEEKKGNWEIEKSSHKGAKSTEDTEVEKKEERRIRWLPPLRHPTLTLRNPTLTIFY